VANFKGSNSAPAFSPDGQNLAVALTRDGISQIYLVPVSGGAPVRLSRSSAIDTEPVFSPDGRYIYFTSDRGGSPQIYRMPASGGAAERVTFEGEYNVSPDVSSDGKLLTFVTRNQGRYQVALLDLQTRQQLILSDSSRDESPSFAPNGRMIVYASESGGRGSLFAVSTDGKVRLRLSAEGADVREPAWGPLPR
jgi:TolB protein